MPWEKSFNEQKAIENAMLVFWEKGYEATSISNLTESTGINRGSLYNAFGGKRQLFIQSLLKYDLDIRKTTLAELENLDNPTLAFKSLFDLLVQQALDDTQKKGCFLVNTALEFKSHDSHIQSIVTQGFMEFEGFFCRGIEVSQTRGEIPSTLDSQGVAKALLSLVIAIRVLGRGVYDESALRTIADQARLLTT